MNHELQSYIKQSIQQFTATITDSAIAELSKNYSELTINGIDDKEGYKIVRTARLDVKARRVEVDKKRKELNEHALAHQKAVNAEAKRITSMLTSIEDDLASKEFAIDNAIQEIQLKAEIERKEKINNRISKLYNVNVKWNPIKNLYENNLDVFLDANGVEELSDHSFDAIYDKFHAYFIEQQLLTAKMEEQKKIEQESLRLEAERLEKLRLEQQAEQHRLQAIAKEQEARDNAIRLEAQRLVNEKIAFEKAESDRLKHLENLEIAKQREIEEQKRREEKLATSERQRMKIIGEIKNILTTFDQKNLTTEQALTLIKRLL